MQHDSTITNISSSLIRKLHWEVIRNTYKLKVVFPIWLQMEYHSLMNIDETQLSKFHGMN